MTHDKPSAHLTVTAWVLGVLMLLGVAAVGLYQLARHDAAICCRSFVGFALLGEELSFHSIEFRNITPVVKFTTGRGALFVSWHLVPFRETHLSPVP